MLSFCHFACSSTNLDRTPAQRRRQGRRWCDAYRGCSAILSGATGAAEALSLVHTCTSWGNASIGTAKESRATTGVPQQWWMAGGTSYSWCYCHSHRTGGAPRCGLLVWVAVVMVTLVTRSSCLHCCCCCCCLFSWLTGSFNNQMLWSCPRSAGHRCGSTASVRCVCPIIWQGGRLCGVHALLHRGCFAAGVSPAYVQPAYVHRCCVSACLLWWQGQNGRHVPRKKEAPWSGRSDLKATGCLLKRVCKK